MGRSCTICESETREAIEEALSAGEPLRDIAEKYGASKSSLGRHRGHTLSPGAVVVEEEEDLEDVTEQEPDLDPWCSKAWAEIKAELSLLTAERNARAPEIKAALQRLAQEQDRIQAEQERLRLRAAEIPSEIKRQEAALVESLAGGGDPSEIREELHRLAGEQVALSREITLLPLGGRLKGISERERELIVRGRALEEAPGRYLLLEAAKLRGELADLERRGQDLEAEITEGLSCPKWREDRSRTASQWGRTKDCPHRHPDIGTLEELAKNLREKRLEIEALAEPTSRLRDLEVKVLEWGRREWISFLAKNRGGKLDLYEVKEAAALLGLDYRAIRYQYNPPDPALELLRDLEAQGLGRVEVVKSVGYEPRRYFFCMEAEGDKKNDQ